MFTSSALSFTCLAYGLSWPARSFMYLDMFNIYMDVIRWKDILNQELVSFVELKILCTTLLEWRWFLYMIQFQIFFGSLLFRYCQTLGLVLRLRVDFVLPLSQQQQQQQQEEEPLTKIFQWGVY